MDRYLPLIEPVGRAILDRLPALAHGANVLDVACGTGEPGLTLARERSSIRLLGVDGVQEMVDIARGKAARERLGHARFEVMNAAQLACDDQTFDAVVSRFGLLMFGDTAASAREMRRVLRRGGSFSLAVWDDMETNTLVRTVASVLGVPPFAVAPGADAGERLRDIDMADVHSEAFRWDYEFASDAALWEFVSGPGLFAGHFATLDAAGRDRVNEGLLAAFSEHRTQGGGYRIPHACRLWWGA